MARAASASRATYDSPLSNTALSSGSSRLASPALPRAASASAYTGGAKGGMGAGTGPERLGSGGWGVRGSAPMLAGGRVGSASTTASAATGAGAGGEGLGLSPSMRALRTASWASDSGLVGKDRVLSGSMNGGVGGPYPPRAGSSRATGARALSGSGTAAGVVGSVNASGRLTPPRLPSMPGHAVGYGAAAGGGAGEVDPEVAAGLAAAQDRERLRRLPQEVGLGAGGWALGAHPSGMCFLSHAPCHAMHAGARRAQARVRGAAHEGRAQHRGRGQVVGGGL